MCLILFSWDNHPKYKLIVAANRDEFYARPTSPLAIWEDENHVIAGKDLNAGGTWLGISQRGKFTALTNYRDPENIRDDAPSRGDLTKNYLSEEKDQHTFYQEVAPRLQEYNGFNLLNGNMERLSYFNNQDKKLEEIGSGIYGLSNAFLDTPWPKVEKGKMKFQQAIDSESVQVDSLLGLLDDRAIAKDEDLPATGVPLEWERRLSAMHIVSENYGTCCSTIVLVDYDGNGEIIEKSYPVGGRKEQTLRFNFKW